MTPEELRKVAEKYGVSPDVARLSLNTGLAEPPQVISQPSNGRLHVRQNIGEDGLNKTERAYLQWLEMMKPDWIGKKAIGFKLSAKCFFYPDFCVVDKDGFRVIDVKATNKGNDMPLIEDDALVKLKWTAKEFPWAHVVVAYRVGGAWTHRNITA